MTRNHFSVGELCLRTVPAHCQPDARGTAKATATETVAVMSEPVSVIAAELRRIRTARNRGARITARRHLDRLIDYVWFSDPDGAA